MLAENNTRVKNNLDFHCELNCLCQRRYDAKVHNSLRNKFLWRRWVVLLMILLTLQFTYVMSLFKIKNDSAEYLFGNLTYSTNKTPTYPQGTPICQLNLTTLGTIKANKTKLDLEWVERQYLWVKLGGFYAPSHCRARYKVAILIPFRNRETNLVILLHHLHPFLKKQLIQYRIFVIEQYGSGKFNKGMLYNIGFLESRQFGEWQCLIFHDVDLLPLDERILYYCPRKPTHMSAAVENHGYQLPYLQLFGGVTALTIAQYKAVNGYSNLYWNWGAEDDDMFIRLQASRYPVLRFNHTVARYAALPHSPTAVNYKRWQPLMKAKRRFRKEGLNTVKYRLLKITKKKLYTHILADVNP